MKIKRHLVSLAVFTLLFNQLAVFMPLKTQAAPPPPPEPELTALATGERTYILTATSENDTTNNNGTEWYYNGDRSMGFAPGGETVELNSADTSDINDPLRLSWHMSGGDINPGWRVGVYNGWSSNYSEMVRYIYQSDNVPDYYPSGPQANIPFDTLDGWTLCFSGSYDDSITASDLWSTTCTGAYLLIAGSYQGTDKIDITQGGISILDTPGGNQLSGVTLYSGQTFSLTMYEPDRVTVVPWSDYRIYISNCTLYECSVPGNPLYDPGSWDSGTAVSSGYTIPSGADSRYLAVVAVDDVTGDIVPDYFVSLTVSHLAVEYTVSSCVELQAVNDHLYDNYTLTTDLDCAATVTWNGGDGFLPIGDETDRFEGNFFGQGHTIANLFIDTDYDYAGLFGVIDEYGTVSDLHLTNVDITGYDYVGALAGALAGTVINCSSGGSVEGDDYVGGLVGQHTYSGGIGSSSPLLYTWNGSEYDYVADPGRSLPRNTSGLDYTPVSGNQLVARDGKYSVKISEEYNEIVYYDELSMLTFDTAPGYRVVTSIARDKEGQFFTISKNPSNPLVSCTDAYGHNCLDSLRNSDDNWSYQDPSNTNYWTMDFGNLSGAQKIQLVMEGAQDYSLDVESVRFIKVKDANGNWVDIYSKSEFSAPSGAPLTKVIDLTGKFLTSDHQVQIGFTGTRMNYFAVDTSTQQPYTMNSYHPTSVNLGFRGYTAIDKTNFWDHDYNTVSAAPEELFANQTGNFTKYGDVTPLLQTTNDQFVVMRNGDYMDIEFAYNAPAAGTERSYVFYSWVTYKHADDGTTVNPLPYKGMSKYPYSAPEKYPLTAANITYLKTWNTRVYTGKTEISSAVAAREKAIIAGLNIADLNAKGAGSGNTIIASYSTADVSGWYSVGGLVGYNDEGIVLSYATGNVTLQDDSWSYGGGLVGDNDGGIYASYATGSVSAVGGARVGGFTGRNEGYIEYCYATGNVTGDNKLGGFTGVNGGDIDNSYARGSVTGVYDLGGFAGRSGEYGYLEEVYSTGAVSGTDDYIGGLIGVFGDDGDNLVNSFFDNQTSGQTVACGNTDCSDRAFGRSTALMKTEATFTTDLGDEAWDFEEEWSINATMNDGYPILVIMTDLDNDGIPNTVELSGPNSGDANDDGIPDAFQENVASFVNTVNKAPEVLEVSDVCTITSVDAQAESGLVVQDAGFDYSAGLTSFTIDCSDEGPGYTADITLYFYDLDPTGLLLRKYNATNSSYTTIVPLSLEQVTIGGRLAAKVVYQVTDGGVLDMDGLVNGIIVDPVGLGFRAVGVPNTGLGGGL